MIALGKMFEMEVADRVVTHADGTMSVVLHEGSIKITEADGTIRSSPAGSILSVQPDGSVEWRAAGAFGQYEKAVVVGNNLVYRPTERAFAFAFAPKLP